ncbi:hypothetical protein HYX02_03780 [Candidatus Woesearchaeota archaeon]|nr:hypothetical protein [Candidatus Woesearchaeota archaeon]
MIRMKIKSPKAQAALEFLTTYGWAFLIILIMIGTLAYFGILKPSKVLPNRCTMGPEFQCLDYQVAYVGATTGTFKIKLKNNIGEPITVSSITLDSETATKYACTTPPPWPTGWKTGEIVDLTWSGCNSAASGMLSGEKGKVLFKIAYYTVSSGSNYAKEVNGEIFSTVI